MIIDFNNDWSFRKEGGEAISVNLPHDAMLTEKRRANCRNGVNTGYFPGGIYLYEKIFSVEEEDVDKFIVLHFEGVYQNCTVNINGKRAGSHRYGYTAFDVDISGFVVIGQNTVSVRVDNSLEPNCRWYSGSGIYRPVTMLIRDKEYIKLVHIETISYSPTVIRVETDGTDVEIYYGDKRVASGFHIADAKLWNAESPNLYTCVVRKGDDERCVNFGIRKLEWSAETGLLVNGSRILLWGSCIHHNYGVLGACEYPDAEERRIRILKENGFNALRVAHKPAS